VAESVVTEGEGGDATRRDFIHIAAGAAAVGAGVMAVWPLINQMNPAADTLALASIEFDMTKVQEGQQVVIKWQGKPVFVRYRTPREIQEAVSTPLSALKDPQTDAERVKRAPAVSRGAGQLHPPGLRADLRDRRLRRLVLPLPRFALRHLRPHP